jgi:GWxTD domain-containing protein
MRVRDLALCAAAVGLLAGTGAKPDDSSQKGTREEKLRSELLALYNKWLEQDAAYIITDEERRAFKGLQTDEERESFIEQFWLRRDPTPDTEENEFKEEHYRRIAYANEHFAWSNPGWRTDRGRVYIMFGPPDEIESSSAFEQWRYRYIEKVGNNIVIDFADPTGWGEYHMTTDPAGREVKPYDRIGLRNGSTNTMNEIELLENRAPPRRIHPNPAMFNPGRITYNVLPLKVRADFIPLTEAATLSNITVLLDNKDLQFEDQNGTSKAMVNMYGRITTMSRRVAEVFEVPVTVQAPTSMLEAQTKRQSICQKSVPLMPGVYRLNIVAKDVIGGNMNNYEQELHVPRLEMDKLSASSLILADLLEKVPSTSIGGGQFVIGDSKVRPKMNETFRKDERMGIYVQLYNFAADEATRKPNGIIRYEVVKNATGKNVLPDFKEEVAGVAGISSRQVTIEKRLPLKDLEPGQYTLRLKVTDRTSNQTITPSATFTVTQ